MYYKTIIFASLHSLLSVRRKLYHIHLSVASARCLSG